MPEINLTPQLQELVQARFPNEPIVALHSKLPDAERASAWLAAHEAHARIVIGTRLAVFASMVRAAAVEHDPAAFRRIVEDAGLLRPGAPVPTDEAGAYFSQFYEAVASDRVMTWTPEYASAIVRHTFDRSSPIAQYATVPRAFVFIQRINLGLYALLGQLGATGNWRRIAEELWPFVKGRPSTPLGRAEATWLAVHHPEVRP